MIKKLYNFFHFHNNHRLSKEKLRQLQEKKLQKIVRHAYESTEFYRSWFDKAGVKPEDIRSADDLCKIPPITKSIIQKNFESFISNRFKPDELLVRSTSGSSGKILRVIWDEYNFFSRILLFYRAFSMIGYGPLKKLMFFIPVVEDPGFSFGLFRQRGLTLDQPFDEVREALLKFRPDILSIYPSYAIDLMGQLSDEDIERIGIEAISLNSEMVLSIDRKIIQEKFKCPVYEEYSSVEFGVIASMCSEMGMHIFSDNVIVEILDKEGNRVPEGEIGEVTLTALNSFGMPFIRYRIGDFSRIISGTCSCGSSMPLLGKIEGRKDDSFKKNSDERIPAWKIYEAVERPLENFGMDRLVINDFYLIQKEYNLAEFYYVPGPHFDSTYIHEVKHRWEGLFGNSIRLNLMELADIDRVKSVKRKYIHCEVK